MNELHIYHSVCFHSHVFLFVQAARLSSPAPSLVSLSLVKEDKSVPGGAIIMPSFLLSTFECDLGHIIRGTSKSRRFKLSNVGASPMSFDVNAKALQRTAFTIAPMKVSRLAPGESVEITVSYAAAVDAEMQPIKLDIPIEVKDAPPYSLQVKCNVTSPMLDVSRTMIDMGPVPMGFVCESLVHFTCVSPIPCEWSAGKLACRSAEEADLFVISPQSGVVQPGQTVTLSVVFRPTKVSAEAIIGKLPVKITSNPKSISLTYRALPSEAGFRLQPSSMILGPIVPTLASAPAPLVLCNDTDTAIEVHSLDFDSKYLQEDDVLRGLTAWDERGELLVQPRRAGQPLPPAVLAHAQRQQDESLLAQLLQAQQPSSAFMPTHPAAGVDSPPVALAVPTALPQKAVLVWVVGPPLSGASSTSTALARKMGVPLLTLSQMLSFFVSDPAGEVADKELVDRLKAADWASREKAPELISACILGYLNAHQTLSLTGAVVDGLDFHSAAHAASVAAGVMQAMSSLDSKRMSPLAWHIFQLDVASEVSATRLEAAAAAVAIELAALDARIDRSWSTGILKAFKPLAADELARMSEEERVAYSDLASKQHLLNTETSLKERQARYLPDAVASKHAQYVEACAVLRDVFAKDAVSVNTPSLATTVAMTPSTAVTASFEPNQTTGTEAEGAPALDVTTTEPETLPVPVAPVETVVIKSRPVSSAAAAPQLPAKFWWRHSMIDAHPALETVASSAATLFDKGHTASDHAASGSASPDDILRQILTKPGQRPARAPITNFQLVNWVEPVVAAATDAPVEGAAAPAAEAAAPAAPTEASTRWVIAPRSSITVGVRYLSDVVGQHDASFGFELFGRAKQYSLPLKGTCAYPEISSDSRTVFMHRIKTKKPNTIVKKQFIADQNVFDFGPLMVGRDAGQASRHDRATMKVFAETFRITNTGLFATRVDFSLRGQMSERPPTAPATGTTPRPGTGEDKKKPAAPVAAPAAAEPAATPAFVFEPEFIELGLDEVKDVTVWAFPSTIGVVEDALVCTVRQNPTPVSFPLRCEGARPACELSAAALNFERMLIAQTDKKTVTLTNTSPLPVVWGLSYAPQAGDAPILNPPPPPSAGGAKPPSAPASTEGAAPATINPTVGGNGQTVLSMDELRIEPASGVLKPLSSVEVAVNYVALQQRIIDRKLKLEIKDNEGVLGVVDTKQLQIQAEAFEIDYKLDLPPGGLDFGSVRVAEDERREFTLKNQGKYEIKYNFSSAPAQPAGGKKRVRSDVLSELITVLPASGELKPQEEIKVVMTFRSSREVTLKANSDMKMTVVEAQTQSSVPVVPIRITANAVFSKYRILPISGINFGPMEIDTIKQKKLEIYNDGEFDFEYKLLAAPKVLPKSRSGTESERPGTSSGKPSTPADAAKPAAAPPSARGAKSDPKAAAAPAASAQQLTVGAFSLTPATGTVPKGGKVMIDISLNANAVEVFQENIELDISNRDPVRDAHIYYELQGEGCAPCIETEDLESIFEEQSVERHVENRLNGKNVFSAEDRIFFFAPVIAAASGTADTAPSVERFKIINPGKVPCNVTFDIKPRDAKSAEEVNAFKLEPAALHIPSHEYRFVSVSFAPKDMAQFSARFTATVEKGSGKTGSMTYELRGQGTLPRVTMERPMVRDESGCPLLQFGRLFMGRSKTMMVVLRNDGVIPSTCRLEVPGAVFGPAAATSGNSFRYMGRSVVTIAPQQTARLPITYRPAAVGSHNGELRLSVSQNPFEDSIIKFVGEAYQEDVTLEGLEGHAEGVGATLDEEDKEGKEEEKDQQAIDFGDVSVGTTKSRTFTLVNHSAFAYRFAWPSGGSSLRYEPSTGHLAPRSNKTITVHFAPSAAQSMSAEIQGVVLERIALEEPDAEGGIWDDRQQELMYLTDKQFEAFQAANEKRNEILKQNSNAASTAIAEAAKATAAFLADPKNKGKTPPAAPVAPQAEVPPPVAVPERDPTDEGDLNARMIAKPEPKYKAVPLPDGAAPPAPIALRVSGVSDLTRYQLNVPSASFRPTMMFQSRVFKFPMRNLSQTQLEYKWRLQMITPSQRELDGTAPLIPVESTFPFIIAPASGKIAPNQEEEFTVKFAPWDAVDYECELIADVVALDPSLSAPRLVLSGTGQRPKCHLELAPCDYLSSNRRAADMRNPDGSVGALDATQFRVVELNSLGTRVRNTKRFFVLNPTNMSYAYEWSCQDTAATSTGASPFRLATTKGLVLAGKRAEMVLEYTPEEVGLSESFWTFTIPEHDIRVQFLFVGYVAEPELALERTHINFNALVVGATQRETAYLVNREHLPFAFTVDPSSYQADGALSVEPTSGVVPPDGRFPVQLRFAPREEKAYNLNVQFRVKNKPGRVVLNVKGEGYAIRDAVQIEEADGRVTELSSTQLSRLDFGTVQLPERAVKRVAIINSGKFNFDFQWTYARSKMLEIVPESGTVKRGGKVLCDVTFVAGQEEVLDRLRAVCAIAGGARQYVTLISGTARRPLLDISSTDVDFGPTFVGARPSVHTLRVTNREPQRNVTVEMVFESRPYLEVRGAAAVLAPGESTEFQLVFTPRDLQAYSETVRLDFNGGYSVNVPVRGEGTALRLELASPAQQNVQFGNLRLGSTATRAVRLVNSSRRTVRMSLKLGGALSVSGGAEVSEESASAAPLTENSLGISFAPHPTAASLLELRPNQSVEMNIRFAPRSRLAAFVEDVSFECEGMVRSLLRLSGACHGVGLAFESDNVPFGSAVLHSSVARRLQLENVGDVGCRFRFDAQRFAPDFSVTPTEGFVAPHDSLTLDLTFHPTKIQPDIRYNRIPCQVDGAPTLYLTLTGACLPSPDEAAKELRFETKVRRAVTRQVVIENPTSVKWSLNPALSHEAWSGPNALEVPAGGKAEYEVTYKPLRTTQSGGEPESTELFFPLPNGQATVYRLIGTASSPDAEDSIEVEAPCKKLFVKSLPVRNWLPRAQRFKVLIETESKDPSVSIKGAASIEVPGLLERELKLSFYAYKEGVTKSTVRFVNETTNEYLFYNVTFTSTKAGVLANLAMDAPVRQRVSSLVSIRNPLADAAEIARFECDSPDVHVALPLRIDPDSERSIEVWYRPLARVKKQTASLALFSPELGDFRYTLELSSSTVPNERTLRFDTSLGGESAQTFRFASFEQGATEFECKVSGSEFVVEQAKIKANGAARGSDGEQLSVELRYEPTNLGDVRDVLTITALNGKGSAEYRVPLYGHCDPPKPLGPIVIKSGANASIAFKNVFANAEEFSFSVDNPNFTVAKPKEKIDAKKSTQLSVSFKAPAGAVAGTQALMAKLTVTCPNMPPWLYYLRGAV
jgi:hydrocephalus-inducing protein